MTPGRIAELETELAGSCAARRYAGGGQLAWLAWTEPLDRLDAQLRAAGLAGLVVLAPEPVDAPLIGTATGGNFAGRVKQAIDPDNRFGPWGR